jgi:hypothetical protein
LKASKVINTTNANVTEAATTIIIICVRMRLSTLKTIYLPLHYTTIIKRLIQPAFNHHHLSPKPQKQLSSSFWSFAFTEAAIS